ncbi:MAG: hypothetical protein EHM24_22745, partial [Acidobacteria bacterium]
ANFDLPVAVSILSATGQADADPAAIPLVGELSLDGRVKPVRGVISMAIAIYRAGYRSVIVPYENRLEASGLVRRTTNLRAVVIEPATISPWLSVKA